LSRLRHGLAAPRRRRDQDCIESGASRKTIGGSKRIRACRNSDGFSSEGASHLRFLRVSIEGKYTTTVSAQ
jgi:hypothetical protein